MAENGQAEPETTEESQTFQEALKALLDTLPGRSEDDLRSAAAALQSRLDDEGVSRGPVQVHFRVNISGLKRVPDATFTVDGDIRDVHPALFWAAHDAFQAEVDKRYPLPPVKADDPGKPA